MSDNHGHTWYKCECNQITCMFCEGGLGACTVCKGAEGTLPTHCPGVKISEDDQLLVWQQGLDYTREKGWFSKSDIHYKEYGCEDKRTADQLAETLAAVERLNQSM